MTIRQATAADTVALISLFDEARATIARLGIDQWQDGYPHRHVIEDGIERGETYCIEIDGTRERAVWAMRQWHFCWLSL